MRDACSVQRWVVAVAVGLAICAGCAPAVRRELVCRHCFCADLGMTRTPSRPISCDTLGYAESCCNLGNFF